MDITTSMTKAELARKLGVSRTYVTMITNGKKKPSQRVLDRLTALGLTANLKVNAETSGGPLAQLAEHLTFNQVVAGSRPARLRLNIFTICKHFANIYPIICRL